jgi:hypothetical protein
MEDVLLVNISWNPTGWRNTYINPKAGHSYTREYPGHESLNFKFDKKGIDNAKYIHGFVYWNARPLKFKKDGIIIFFSRNNDLNINLIVGIYGIAEVVEDNQTFLIKGFKNNRYSINIRAEKDYSLLFPIPLDADKYKIDSRTRLIGQNGFSYRTIEFAETIIYDELVKLSESGILESDYTKLKSLYEYYTGKDFETVFVSSDVLEQNEISKFYKKKSKEELQKELMKSTTTDSEIVVVNLKRYKRNNKTIALIKLLRNFQCQICGASIIKKDGSKYIEAAHIIPKHKKGIESSDNIILLCPNHHKEFDLGDLKIISHNKSSFEFILNGKNHKLNLN